MKTMRGKQGFSLVELLTVIAIIGILAAIIFPVMGSVKNRAKETQCVTNLHNIALAVSAFQLDNRRFPDALAGTVQTQNGNEVIPLERVRNSDGLYPEYIKAAKGFHCPLSPTTSTSAAVRITRDGKETWYYAYSSYDIYTQGLVTETVDGNYPEDVRYTTKWADTEADVDKYLSMASESDPSYDYKRQLRFRNPSGDTVVTWCSYHKRPSDSKSPALVLFLDGHVDRIPISIVEGNGVSDSNNPGCRWRTEPNK